MKFKKKIQKIVEKEPEKVVEQRCFQTVDKSIVYKLVSLGFNIKSISNPFGERLVKLYTFQETEEQAKEKLNVQ